MKKLLLLLSLCLTIFVGCSPTKEVPPEAPIAPVEVGPTDTINTPVGGESPNPVTPPVEGVTMEGTSGK